MARVGQGSPAWSPMGWAMGRRGRCASMSFRTRTGLVSSAALALVLLGAAGCGDDDSSSAPTTTTEASTTADDDGVTSSSSPATSSTTDPDGPTSSTGTTVAVTDRTTAPDEPTPGTGTTEAIPQTTEPNATTSTSDPPSTAPTPGGGLADRLPEIDGFERSVALEDDDGFDGELCDGSTASVTPAAEGAVEYDQDEVGEAQFDVIGLAFASAADAATFFAELTSTTAGCETDDLTIDQGTSSEIGDEGVVYRLTGGGDDVAMTGLLYMSLSGDEVWVLGQERMDSAPAVVDPVLDAFRSAVER